VIHPTLREINRLEPQSGVALIEGELATFVPSKCFSQFIAGKTQSRNYGCINKRKITEACELEQAGSRLRLSVTASHPTVSTAGIARKRGVGEFRLVDRICTGEFAESRRRTVALEILLLALPTRPSSSPRPSFFLPRYRESLRLLDGKDARNTTNDRR
jgi:hypothetical protein